MNINYCVPKIEYIYVTEENAKEVMMIIENSLLDEYANYKCEIDLKAKKCYLFKEDLISHEKYMVDYIFIGDYYVNEHQYIKDTNEFIDNWVWYKEWEFNNKYLKLKEE